MGAAQLAGDLQLVVGHIDHDHLHGAGNAGRLHRGQANTAGPDHAHRRARGNLGRAEHGPHAGGDATADERSPVEGHLVDDLHHAVLVDQHLLGEPTEPSELIHRSTILLGQPWRCPLRARGRRGVVAAVGVAGETLAALATEDRYTTDHMVARFDVGHVVAHGFHDAGGLMAQHRRQLGAEDALHEMEIRVAEPGPLHLNEHLIRPGPVDA